MPDIDFVSREIEPMRVHVGRQRKRSSSFNGWDIHRLVETLLGRMLTKIDKLANKRDALRASQPGPVKGRGLGRRKW